VGRTDIEDALKRLDKLTQDEVRMATAQLLKLTHAVDDKVNGVSDTVKLVLDGAWCEIFVYQFRY
jgi:ribosome recycling factor